MPTVLVVESRPTAIKTCPVLFADAGATATGAHVNEFLLKFNTDPVEAVGSSVKGPQANTAKWVEYGIAGFYPALGQGVVIDAAD